VIEALAALPPDSFATEDDSEALRLLIVEALRRFDRLAFASYWRSWREELSDDLHRLDARLGDFPIAENVRAAIFVPSRFAPPGFLAPISGEDTVLVPFDPDRLPVPSTRAVAMRARMPTPRDPALVFRALGDATRYTIAGLIAREPMTSAELARRLEISKPTMAHHLRALRAAGLVMEETRGTRIVLALDRAALAAVSDAAVAQFFGPSVDTPIQRSRRPR